MPSYTREDLVHMAGAKSYHRGVDYVSQVSGVTFDGRTVRGTVAGTHTYLVELTPTRRGMEWDCDCPWAEEGNFCKHCVALGLVYLYDSEHAVEVPTAPGLRCYLSSLGTDELVDLVLAAADDDPGFRRRLETSAELAGGLPGGAGARARVERALRIDGFVEYRQAREYAGTVHRVVGELEGLLERGEAAAAEELARHAITALSGQAGMVDDSAGHVGGAAAELVEVHVEACAAARPDASELTGWLLGLQVKGSGLPELLLDHYAEALGEAGLEAYGERLFADGFSASEWTMRFLRSEYARLTGDTDLLVRVYGQGERVYYAGIVEALQGAGRAEEALEWAFKGLREPGRPDQRLLDHLTRALREQGRAEELQAVRWEAFERSPGLTAYRALREDTPQSGWPAVREQALTLLRRAAARRPGPHFPCPLVEVLLDEGDGEQVWAAAAEHGCDAGQWLRVAALREETHPEDAIGVYAPMVQTKLRPASTGLYPKAAELARRVYDLYGRSGREDQARSFLVELRTEHRRKRRFLAELDRVGLGG
ncbi:SWIM zinc finger family protein [Nocardiopsis metallicus]|uniref:Tetratricopeptide (TPR) repeat protein n=1 Tax=Nocardiopsis metallicus TaxID=179819 RepID=A0A840VYK6_9ACTN|nr:DUF6880 family protein [Nocardiopsis metallicus]MBB5489580.1 tetratricopeptide (TPR) repeat protein [Nocardiopsis metallicus]